MVAGLLFATGCPSTSTTGDAATSNPTPDLTDTTQMQSYPDLVPEAMPDLVEPPPPPDLRSPTAFNVRYRTYSAQIQSGTNNGFASPCAGMAVMCGDPADKSRTTPPFTQLTLTVTNTTTKKAETTQFNCVPGVNSGTTDVKLPDTTGPFVITGGMVGVTYPAGFVGAGVVDPFSIGDSIEVTLYACGCDAC